MRMLLKASMEVEAANAAAMDNRLGQIVSTILEDTKPEAAYFTAEYGMRTAYIFVDVEDASQIPLLAEPWFISFNASIELMPVMVIDDLKKAAPDFEKVNRKYGGT